MHKTRNIFLIIVLNVFLMLAVSLLLEYNNLAERLTNLENNVYNALQLAVDTTVSSEEFFSSSYQEQMSSNAIGSANLTDSGYTRNATMKTGAEQGISVKDGLGAAVLLWDYNSVNKPTWFYGNAYYIADYYLKYGALPRSFNGHADALGHPSYSSYLNSMHFGTMHGTRAIYAGLFGNVGADYMQHRWANGSSLVYDALYSIGVGDTDRSANDEFRDFATKIGYKITYKAALKEKTENNKYRYVQKEIPVLANMGLDFNHNIYDKYNSQDGSVTQYMLDNFCMSAHAGKYVNGKPTIYFLTPMSLGVTYVPKWVVKPVFIGNLDTIVRLQKLSGASYETLQSGTEIVNTITSATACDKPDVFTGSNFTQAEHHTNYENIISDGNVEYILDSNSVLFRIDYFTADFYSTDYKNIAAKIEGSLTSNGLNQQETLNALGPRLRYSDTAQQVNGTRIVAKVTVRMKVNILYQSSILQWLSYKDWLAHGANGEWHASIKELNPSTGRVIRDGNDGTWYQCSTYIAIAR